MPDARERSKPRRNKIYSATTAVVHVNVIWRCMKTSHNDRAPQDAATAHDQSVNNVRPLPRYLRLPRSGERCPHTGLSRSALNSLILGPRPLVHSISLGARHKIRGTRLICGESLVAYLRSLAKSEPVHAATMATEGDSDLHINQPTLP